MKNIKKSDHNLLILEINLKWSSLAKTQRIEIYNYKNEDDFQNFQSNTENNDELLKCFAQFSDLTSACNKWLRVLNQTIRKSFKKIRISKWKNPSDLNLLFQKKESIKQKINEAEANDNLDELMNLEDDYEEVTEEIATVCAQRNRDIVKEYLEQGDDDEPHNQLKT